VPATRLAPVSRQGIAPQILAEQFTHFIRTLLYSLPCRNCQEIFVKFSGKMYRTRLSPGRPGHFQGFALYTARQQGKSDMLRRDEFLHRCCRNAADQNSVIIGLSGKLGIACRIFPSLKNQPYCRLQGGTGYGAGSA
jgi:hypothetical protein